MTKSKMCRIGVVLCVCEGLERGWRGRNVHGGGVPVRPSCLYIIATIYYRLGACEAVRDVVRAQFSRSISTGSTHIRTGSTTSFAVTVEASNPRPRIY